MKNKEIVRKYFRKLGYRGKYDQKIRFIVYKFDLFTKDSERIAVYVLDSENSFASLVDVAKTIAMLDLQLKICLFIPKDFSLPVDVHHKALGCNVDLYMIEKGHIEPLTRGIDQRIVEEFIIKEIERTLININRICENKWGILFFKIKKNLFKKLYSNAKNEKEFIYQIATILSVIESINSRDIKNFIQPRIKKEKEIFFKNQSISIIELFLDKARISYNKSLIVNMRDLRDLRNIPPIHPSSNFSKVCKKFIGKIPKNDSDWSYLSQVAFARFRGTLILFRDVLK